MAKLGAMARASREVWEKRIQRLHESDLTDAEFAREIGVNVHTLRSWKWKLRSEAEGRGRSRGPRATRSRPAATPAATFVEMHVAPEGTERAAPVIELRVSGVDVRVPVGFDEVTLWRLLSLLRGAA